MGVCAIGREVVCVVLADRAGYRGFKERGFSRVCQGLGRVHGYF
jgi:hypothetical protein